MIKPKAKATTVVKKDNAEGYLFLEDCGEYCVMEGSQYDTVEEATQEAVERGYCEFVVYKLTRVGKYRSTVQKVSD